eukprot:79000-Chlamydomonas_euryale.AAC.3
MSAALGAAGSAGDMGGGASGDGPGGCRGRELAQSLLADSLSALLRCCDNAMRTNLGRRLKL